MSKKPVYNPGERRLLLQGRFKGRVCLITERTSENSYVLELDGEKFTTEVDAILKYSDPTDLPYKPDPNETFKRSKEDASS